VGDRITIMGLPIDGVTEDEAADFVRRRMERGEGGHIVTPNLDQLRLFRRSPLLRSIFLEADLVLADGMPLVWASRLQGTSLPARVPGSTFVSRLMSEAAGCRSAVFLLGGAAGTAEKAAGVLQREHPDVDIAGVLSPPFGFETRPESYAAVERSVVAAKPGVVLVGLGFPKQEFVARRLLRSLPGTWFMSVGITFSFLAGELKRAPEYLQSLGLEWLHRLVQQPHLAGRYLVRDVPFAFRLFAHVLARRAGLPHRAHEGEN
jgi:exopolysaccharide biosynthesis WecB/TagA/CpsF family protein